LFITVRHSENLFFSTSRKIMWNAVAFNSDALQNPFPHLQAVKCPSLKFEGFLKYNWSDIDLDEDIEAVKSRHSLAYIRVMWRATVA
jgi:hypothetical protein